MVRSILTVVAIVAGFAFSGVAQAADIPRKAPPQVVVPVYNWTGLYVGAHVGGGWGNSTWFDVGPGAGLVLDTSNRHKMSGGLGGLQIGYNHQVGNWVFGVEGDFSGTGIKGNGLFDPTVGRDPIESKVRWLATFTGRIGYAMGPWLPYVRGGAVWADERYSLGIPLIGVATSTEDTRTGFTVGAGVEYGVTNNWSVRLGYDYLGLGTEQIRFTAPQLAVLPNFPFDVRQHLHVVKFAVNYRFGR